MPTRSAFDNLLGGVKDDLLRMGSMVDRALADSMKALQERNEALALKVSTNDATLNVLRYEIEERCYATIALQQPNATDLRVIVGAVSVVTNLERIADHAAGIARLTLKMIDQPLLEPLVDIPQMAEIGRQMTHDSLEAFTKPDVELAEKVVARDRDLDTLQRQVSGSLIQFMAQDSATIERATYLLWVSHNLERIGDRATNICERAIYVATGELKEFN